MSAERLVIERRRHPAVRLGLASQMGFLRTAGRPLEGVGAVPSALGDTWAQGRRSPPVICRLCGRCTAGSRRSTSTISLPLRCSAFGIGGTEAQRRALLRALRTELRRTGNRERLRTVARPLLYEHRLIVPRERELRGI